VRQQSDSTAVADSLPLQKLERFQSMWTTIIRCSGSSGPSTGKLFNVSWSLPGARQTKTSMEDLGCHGQSHFRRPPDRVPRHRCRAKGRDPFQACPPPSRPTHKPVTKATYVSTASILR
jgi:hypothetical protein